LSDDGAILEKKINNLMSRRYLFKAYPEMAGACANLGSSWLLPDSFIPLVLLKIFSPRLEANELARFKSPHNQEELRAELKAVLSRVLGPIREMRTYYADHEEQLWDRLMKGTEEATTIARFESARIWSALSA
jgi:hypothetical protein